MLNDDMKRLVNAQRLGFVATVCADGTPNLSPKGTTAVWDDSHLVFLDLGSPQTIGNIEAGRDSVEVNVVDPIIRKGYRFKGRAAVHYAGPIHEAGLRKFVEERGIAAERVRGVVLIEVHHAAPLISPVYEGGATEEEVVKRSLDWYGLDRRVLEVQSDSRPPRRPVDRRRALDE